MLKTGIRPIEVFRLRREDVEIEKDRLQITQSKTKTSIRRVPLSAKAKTILRGRIERFDGDFLFPHNEKDGAKPIRGVGVFHRKVIKTLGFKFRLYDCRHSF